MSKILPRFPRLFSLVFLMLGMLFGGPLWAQTRPGKGQAYELHVQKTDSAVHIDGLLTESVWQKASSAADFFINYPADTAFANSKTEVRMAFDDHHLYVAAVLYNNADKPFVVSSLRRDFDWDLNDNFSVYLSPFADGLNGFAFLLNPYGAQGEGLLFNGQNVAGEWDNKWYSAVRIEADRWVVEMAIPFKTLRYKHGGTHWKANFARNDLKNNQVSSWRPVPIAYWVSSLAYAGDLYFDQPLPNPGANVSVIPYLTGGAQKQHAEGSAAQWTANAGLDAKVAVTPSLNLDLTVNPDFSQVEVDQQVTNLDRFEIFFPERRQFFLENNDLFDNFGFERVKPFFSRRIGIGRDTLTGQIKQNPIVYGARLSGKLDKNWRVGLLNMQTANDRRAGIAAQNYTVAAVQRQVFARSNIAAIVVNRQQSALDPAERYNRLVGLDYNLQSADNKWTGKFFYHHSLRPGQPADSYTHGSQLTYASRNVSATWLHEYVGQNYRVNDVGYVARDAHWRVNPTVSLSFFPKKSSWLAVHGPSAELNIYTDPNGQLNDRELDLYYTFTLQNTSEITVGYYRYFTRFYFDFDPTNSGGVPIAKGSAFAYGGAFWFYQSDQRKRLTFSTEGYTGGYYNGRIFNLIPALNYRFQPFGSVGLRVEYNGLQFPEPYSSARYWLVGPRIDVSFTRSLFLTTFLQYNQQADNVNLNARLQWRFKPVSDLFVVYSDNYFPDNFKVKSRALVLKLSYWFNL